MRGKYVVRLAFHFGIRPWDIDRLTIDEFYAFCDGCDLLNEREAG